MAIHFTLIDNCAEWWTKQAKIAKNAQHLLNGIYCSRFYVKVNYMYIPHIGERRNRKRDGERGGADVL